MPSVGGDQHLVAGCDGPGRHEHPADPGELHGLDPETPALLQREFRDSGPFAVAAGAEEQQLVTLRQRRGRDDLVAGPELDAPHALGVTTHRADIGNPRSGCPGRCVSTSPVRRRRFVALTATTSSPSWSLMATSTWLRES